MSLSSDQNQSIEEIIEPVNRYFHNPIGTSIVKFLKDTWVTPDQVTYGSIVIGLIAAYVFSLGTTQSFFLAGTLLEIVMILDCVDGQLARAKNCSSDWGRLLDGIAGYIIYLAVLVGIMIALDKHHGALIVVGVLTILRAISYDYCKLTMITIAQKGYDGNQKEISDIYLKISKNPSMIFKVYFYYLQFQQFIFCGKFSSFAQFNENDDLIGKINPLTSTQRGDYRKKNSSLMIVWSWNGVDLPIFFLVLLSIFGSLEVFIKPLAYFLASQFIFTMVYHHFRYSSFP